MELETEKLNMSIVDMCTEGQDICLGGILKDKIPIGDFIAHCKECTMCGDSLMRYVNKLKPYLFANLISIKSFLK